MRIIKSYILTTVSHLCLFGYSQKHNRFIRSFSQHAIMCAKNIVKYDSQDTYLSYNEQALADDFKNNPVDLDDHFDEKHSTINIAINEVMDLELPS